MSVIVPIYNESQNLHHALLGFQALRELGAELILVDGGSSDGSHALLWRYRNLWDSCIVGSPGRARQMNAGAALAQSELLMFLHLDSKLIGSPPLDKLLELAEMGKWSYFTLALSSKKFPYNWIASSINWRSRINSNVTGDQVFCLSKKQFMALGGYQDIPLMEDVALCDRLKRQARGVCLSYKVETSCRRWQKNGVLKTIVMMWWFRFLYRCGVSPNSLAKRYYPGINFDAQPPPSYQPLESLIQQQSFEASLSV
ncbi:TIGR04283 family arsenosugar biosynthesis glycosyltransferase [uncultured Pseudoteredinibacter sp.]|uniref:TIGR04283 family arsenosugar biosynthesis glycosyltransferase n=1 Tax=uncultured Pseudoteredinibacter sp. TaxID=1641701 RepID=UPI00261ACAA4|nr:TIGR04283 family arsenosugar biosynthesis glycosyltransferase [uncultured Pseudoteredinibacter sp.]